jgi:hypothetical protein
MTAAPQTHRPGAGWLVFAGVMLFVAGAVNVIDGVSAITDSKFYFREAAYFFGSLHVWGWIHLVLGGLLIAAVFGIWSGAGWARWFAIGVAALNAITRLMFVQAYPYLSLALFAVDVLVIYGLAAYGGRRAAAP